ncbi:hypothetical protein PHYPSEUDO_006594 [Phytophthora pseudosyringae]|uniref:Uncharacterized protein n=1 Tax=Phytophthora pseudosyringae TaxID=221518 RepID=A0A8T1VJ15_9STRA|nr:hypothetical protein PHYPSEUDO_006594 [Phytophthora pseudosyringae]
MEVMTSVCVVCRADPRIQALDHVAMTIDGFADCSVLWTLPTAVKSRLEHLSQRVLRRIRDASELGDKDKRQQLEPATRYAAAMGNLPLMQQLHEIGFVPLDNRMAVAAALNGDLSLLKWIQASAPQLFNHVRSWAEQVAFDVAAERGCLETVQWLVETFPGAVWPLGPAALGGNLGMVKWLHEHANLEAAQMHFHFGILDKLTFVQCTQYVEECCSDEKEGVEAVGWRIAHTPRAVSLSSGLKQHICLIIDHSSLEMAVMATGAAQVYQTFCGLLDSTADLSMVLLSGEFHQRPTHCSFAHEGRPSFVAHSIQFGQAFMIQGKPQIRLTAKFALSVHSSRNINHKRDRSPTVKVSAPAASVATARGPHTLVAIGHGVVS